MKKLMVVVAIVFTTVFAHAGVYAWGLTNDMCTTSKGGNDYLSDASFTVALFLGTIAQTDNGDGTYTLGFNGTTLIDQTSKANANLSIGGTSFDATRTNPLITTDASQAYSILVFDTKTGVTDFAKYEGTYALLTGDSSLSQDPGSYVDYAAFKSATALGASDYHFAVGGGEPVPEPTSGLLLILGVAGMALRRRRM